MTIINFRKFYGGVLPQLNTGLGLYEVAPLNYDKLVRRLGDEIIGGTGSAVNELDSLAKIMETIKPTPIDIIEIGTFMGIGTALLASYANHTVATFDIQYRNSHNVWEELGLLEKINCFTGDQPLIDELIQLLRNQLFNFNFAFIDGMHEYDRVKHDFANVCFCGRVLFHDAHIPEIKDFILNEIGGIILEDEIFGYWERKK